MYKVTLNQKTSNSQKTLILFGIFIPFLPEFRAKLSAALQQKLHQVVKLNEQLLLEVFESEEGKKDCLGRRSILPDLSVLALVVFAVMLVSHILLLQLLLLLWLVALKKN